MKKKKKKMKKRGNQTLRWIYKVGRTAAARLVAAERTVTEGGSDPAAQLGPSRVPSPQALVCMPQSFDEWCRNLVILR